MKNHQTKSTTITKQRIASPKGLQLLCALLALVLDGIVLVILWGSVTEIKFLICPILIAVLDTLFIIKVLFSNYRFSYALNGVVIHMVCMAVVCVYAWLTTGLLEDRVVFVTFALYAMPAVHLLQCLAALCNAFHGAHRGKLIRKISAVTLSVLFLAGVAIYGRFLLADGFFGQGNDRTQRTVTYSLDETETHYVVTGVLDGKGNAVTIPDTFNGLPVGGVDCLLFADPELSYVTFDCSSQINFLNMEELKEVNETLRVETGKARLDEFRSKLYLLATTNPEMLYLANHIFPNDVTGDEVYVTFRYEYNSLAFVKDHIMPTWFGTKGQTFDIYAHAGTLPYMENSNVDDTADLYWCYQNQRGRIFRSATSETYANLNGTGITESLDATLVFDKIYQLNIAEDNDEKYSIDPSYTTIETADGQQPYKLATADRIANVLSAVPGRNGFTLYWYMHSQNGAATTDLATELARLDQMGSSVLALDPIWELNAPTITKLTADGVSEDHVQVYGNNVQLASAATPPDPAISVRYEWLYNGSLATTNEYLIENLHPEDAGTYTLSVTAYSDALTSLTRTVTQTIEVGFQKRELNFSWSLPQGADAVYSATDKPISGSYERDDVINNDTITFTLSHKSVRDAATYALNVTLTNDAATKYQIPETEAAQSLTIEPYELIPSWGGTDPQFEYNGTEQGPTATARGLGNDGTLLINIIGKGKNVGAYTATATTPNTNYRLVNNTMSFEITHRPITGLTWDKNTFVYNSGEQGSRVTGLTNVVSGETAAVLASLSYDGDATDVGNYMAVAALPQDSNYVFQCDYTQYYDITPLALTVTVDNKTHSYNGQTFTGFTFRYSALAGDDRIDEVLSLDYTGEAVTAVDVGTGAYVINANPIGGTKYGNYDVTVEAGALTIQPKALTVTLNNASKTYDGQSYPAADFTYTYSGLATTDTIDQVLTVRFTGTAVNAVNAGSNYTLSADTLAGEKYGNYTVTVINGKLTINRAPLTVTAVGGSKVYDGTVFGTPGFMVNGLVGGDTKTELGTPTYSGNGATTANAGSHVLSVSLPSNTATNNYSITYHNGTVEITKKDLTVTAVGGTKTYDGTTSNYRYYSFTATGLVSADTVSELGSATYGGEATTNKNVGTHTLTVTLNENSYPTKNYNITYVDGTFTVTPKSVTVSGVTISKVYDGHAGGDLDFTVSGLATGDTKASFGTPVYSGNATSATDVGTYTYSVQLSGNDNYRITYGSEGTLKITRKTLTVTAVATDRAYESGVTGGTFSYRVEGLVAGDTAEDLGEAVYSGTAVTAQEKGTYTLKVVLSDAASMTNYQVVYVDDTDFEIS